MATSPSLRSQEMRSHWRQRRSGSDSTNRYCHGNSGSSNLTQIAAVSSEISFPVIAKMEKSPFSTLRLRAQKKAKAMKDENNRAEETTIRAGASYGSLSEG